jgi:hypothetical protein
MLIINLTRWVNYNKLLNNSASEIIAIIEVNYKHKNSQLIKSESSTPGYEIQVTIYTQQTEELLFMSTRTCIATVDVVLQW